MPLHLAHHKSYHPYNAANQERVRRDEAKESARIEAEERQRHDAESQARREALRRKGGQDPSLAGPSAASSTGVFRSSSSGKGREGHINFWQDLENGSGTAATSSRASLSVVSKPALDRETLAHALGGPSAAVDREPWYAMPDMVAGSERRRSNEQRLEATYRDTQRKSREDPMRMIHVLTDQRRERQEKRARAIERAKQQESPYRPSTSSEDSREYSDQFNRDDVRAAHKRRRRSSPSSSSRLHQSSELTSSERFNDTALLSHSTTRSDRLDHAASSSPLYQRLARNASSSARDNEGRGAMSFPPCGQASHSHALHPRLDPHDTKIDPIRTGMTAPSSADVKKEPDSDDLPIAAHLDRGASSTRAPGRQRQSFEQSYAEEHSALATTLTNTARHAHVKVEMLSDALQVYSSTTTHPGPDVPICKVEAATSSLPSLPSQSCEETSPTVGTPSRAPLTIIDAQKSGLFPHMWAVGKMPSLTQGSEWDELGTNSTQLTLSGSMPPSTPTPSQRLENTNSNQTCTQASEHKDAEDASICPPTESDAASAPTVQDDGELAPSTADICPDQPPQRSQQHSWGTGIWRSHDSTSRLAPPSSTLVSASQMTEESGLGQAESSNRLQAGAVDNSANVTEEQARLEEAALHDAETHFRESMYPAAMGDMIGTVLEHEEFLFTANESAFLKSYAKLSYPARYLFARLIQRKHRWYRVSQLKYQPEVRDTQAIVGELATPQPGSSQVTQDEPALTRFALTQADEDFHDNVSDMLALLSVEELKILAKKMGVLKAVHTTRASLIEVLLSVKNQSTLNRPTASASKQGSKSGPSHTPNKTALRQLTLNLDHKGKMSAQSSLLKRAVQDVVGNLVCIPGNVRSLIDRVALVYYRGNVHNSVGNALSLAVLARSKRRNFPLTEVRRSADLFKSRDQLRRYEQACAKEYKMVLFVDGAFEANRTPGAAAETYLGHAAYDGGALEPSPSRSADATKAAIELFESIFQEWKDAVRERQQESSDEDAYIWYHRMRFHPGWPLTRIVYKSLACFARLKQYEREKEILDLLIAQKVFCRGKRGEWYDRLALISERYLNPTRAGKRQARDIAARGLEDPDTHLIHHRALRNRIKRIEDQIKVPKREKRDFEIFELRECKRVVITGFRLDRMLQEDVSTAQQAAAGSKTPVQQWSEIWARKSISAGNGKSGKGKSPVRSVPNASPPRQPPSPDQVDGEPSTSRRIPLRKVVTVERPVASKALPSPDEEELQPFDMEPDGKGGSPSRFEVAGTETKTSMHSVWRGRDGAPCGVEELCLQHYAEDGWKGIHCEGGIIRMLFVLVMWDIIFLPVEGAFETQYQSEPLDMRSDAFAVVRKAEIRQRLNDISNHGGLEYIIAADDRERPRQTWAAACLWDRYTKEQLVEVATCLGGSPLSAICKMFCEEWEHCQAGMPDLCIWKPEQKRLKLVEVKGPGDSLREKQRVWIDALLEAGVDTELAIVKDLAAPLDSTAKATPAGRATSSPKRP